VLAVPFDLHHRLARDAVLAKAALAIFLDEVERFLYGAVTDDEAQLTPADEAQVTPAEAPSLGGGRRARAGFFTATQAFGSSLNVHFHWHVLATDGLYEQQPDGSLRFLRAAAATREELTSVVQRVGVRVRALVGAPDESAEPIVQAPVLKVFGAEPRDAEEPSRAVQHDGFNLHANVAFEAHERVAVERLCRYMLRGPLASGRLRRGRADKLIYDLAHPRADGTTQMVLSPMALLQRLSWLCVLPRVHTTHYHGVLSSAHPWRALVVPKQEKPSLPPLRRCSSRWIDWASLLRRVFLTDVLLCQLCGGRRSTSSR
jgi:hypothetical protein